MGHRAVGLRYAVRPRVLGKYFGQLAIVFSLLALVPLAVSLSYGEYRLSLRYLVVAATSAVCGAFLARLRAPSRIQVNEGMVIVASAFLLAPLATTFPMTATGVAFVDALFEAISGSTTTGLSTLSNVEEASPAFLFSRAWMQWYGGLGIVVLSLALVLQPGPTAKNLAVTEAQPEDLPGSTRAHARRVLLAYGLFTGGTIVTLWLFGARLLDAVVYAFAAVSTGGFAPHNDSLAGLDVVLQVLVTVACLLCALPFSLFRRHRNQLKGASNDLLQVKGLLVCAILMSVLLGATLRFSTSMSWLETLQHGSLLALSAQTTAGFSTTSVADLDASSKLVLILSMLIGGGVGSTAGGFKILRLLILLHLLHVLIVRASLPHHAVLEPRLGHRRLSASDREHALLLVLLYPFAIVLSWLLFLFWGYDPLDSLFEVTSAVGTVGLSVGITESNLPDFLKLLLCADMLLGRLECVAWLVFFCPTTWLGQRRKET